MATGAYEMCSIGTQVAGEQKHGLPQELRSLMLVQFNLFRYLECVCLIWCRGESVNTAVYKEGALPVCILRAMELLGHEDAPSNYFRHSTGLQIY